MSLLALATWSAVVILVAGSLAVFVWFLFDAGKVLHGDPPEGRVEDLGGRGRE